MYLKRLLQETDEETAVRECCTKTEAQVERGLKKLLSEKWSGWDISVVTESFDTFDGQQGFELNVLLDARLNRSQAKIFAEDLKALVPSDPELESELHIIETEADPEKYEDEDTAYLCILDVQTKHAWQ